MLIILYKIFWILLYTENKKKYLKFNSGIKIVHTNFFIYNIKTKKPLTNIKIYNLFKYEVFFYF